MINSINSIHSNKKNNVTNSNRQSTSFGSCQLFLNKLNGVYNSKEVLAAVSFLRTNAKSGLIFENPTAHSKIANLTDGVMAMVGSKLDEWTKGAKVILKLNGKTLQIQGIPERKLSVLERLFKIRKTANDEKAFKNIFDTESKEINSRIYMLRDHYSTYGPFKEGHKDISAEELEKMLQEALKKVPSGPRNYAEIRLSQANFQESFESKIKAIVEFIGSLKN